MTVLFKCRLVLFSVVLEGLFPTLIENYNLFNTIDYTSIIRAEDKAHKIHPLFEKRFSNVLKNIDPLTARASLWQMAWTIRLLLAFPLILKIDKPLISFC